MKTDLIVSDTVLQGLENVVSFKQFKTTTIAELKEYEHVILLGTNSRINADYLNYFLHNTNYGFDYTLFGLEEKQECYAVSVNTLLFSNRLKKMACQYTEKTDLYSFCCELKKLGYSGEAILLDTDYLETIIEKTKQNEMDHSLTNAEIYLKEYCSHYEHIYIYGAGRYGLRCLKNLTNIGIQPEAFIETNKTASEIENIKVLSINEITINEADAVILALKKDFCFQVLPRIVEKGIMNYCIYPFWLL